MRTALRLAGSLLILTGIVTQSPVPAQTGAFSAVGQFQRLSTALRGANAVEYTSVVSALTPEGRPITLYVHAKLQRPGRLWMSVSREGLDAPGADLIVANPNIIYEYDPRRQRVAQGTPLDDSMTLPSGFTGADPALQTARQFFLPQPFARVLPSDSHSPLMVTRRGLDLPNTLLLSSLLSGGPYKPGPLGQEEWAKVWVDVDTATPRRIVMDTRVDGVDHETFHEEFTKFTLNPDIPTEVFLWTPPDTSPRRVVTPPPAKPAAPTAKKAKAARPHAHPH